MHFLASKNHERAYLRYWRNQVGVGDGYWIFCRYRLGFWSEGGQLHKCL